jgi:hypothetical protein
VEFGFEFRRVNEGVRGLVMNEAGVLLPDVVTNIVTGKWGNVAVMNVASSDNSSTIENWLELISITFELLVIGGSKVCIFLWLSLYAETQ